VLRARALQRLGRHYDVIALMHDEDIRDSPAAQLQLAMAFARSRDCDSAREIVDGLQRSDRLDLSTRAEIARCAALIAWMAKDDHTAERLLDDAPLDPSPAARASHYQLRSWIAARREDYGGQARLLASASQALLEDPSADVGLLADIVRTLALLNREMRLPDVSVIVERLVAEIPWTDDLRVQRYHATRMLGWYHALDGRFFPARRLLHEAERFAPSPAWRFMALLDRATLAKWASEPASSSATLYEALGLESGIAWDLTDDEERFALLSAAEVCVDVDAVRAHALLNRFNGLMEGFGPRMGARGDRRVAAFRATAAGAVQRALGQERSSIDSYQAAYAVFAEVGYRWRAAMCAVRLHGLTGEQSWLGIGASLIREYPHSWIAGELASSGVHIDDAVRRLTPREREVLRGLLEGLRITKIAERLRISPHTAKHYATKVYAAFGVDCQSQLMAEAKRRRFA
jgi:DNA-binding NarL/FixJ family response regulator